MWFFGGGSSLTSSARVLFFGYGGAYHGRAHLGHFRAFPAFFKLFRSGCKKTPQAPSNGLWETSYFGEDGVGVRFGKLNYAVATLDRAVPAGAVFDKRR